MTSANKQDAPACEGWDMTEVGHAGLANLSKLITAYDFHVRYNNLKYVIAIPSQMQSENNVFYMVFKCPIGASSTIETYFKLASISFASHSRCE